MRIYGNTIGEVPGNYVLSQGDIPNTTIKETTLFQPNSFIGNQNENAAYLVTDQQSVECQRDTLNHDSFMGMSSKNGNRQYDAVYRQTNSEAKEKSIAGRVNQGNAKNFNSQINVTMSKLDSDRDNNRLWAPQAVIANGPTVQTHGKVSQVPQYMDNCIGCTRIEPSLLDAFRNNPYTHSLTNAV